MKMGSLFSIIRLEEHDICNGPTNRYRSVAQTGAQNCSSYARALPQSDCKFASISFATRFARPPSALAAAFKSPSLGALCAKKKRLVRVSICWCNESDIKRRICCRWFLTDVRKKGRFSRSLLRMSGTTVAEKWFGVGSFPFAEQTVSICIALLEGIEDSLARSTSKHCTP